MTAENRIDRRELLYLGQKERGIVISLACKARSGYNYYTLVSGYATRQIDEHLDSPGTPFLDIWHPPRDRETGIVRGGEDLIALVRCRPNVEFAPQELDGAVLQSPHGLDRDIVYYETPGPDKQRRHAIVKSFGATVRLPDIYHPQETNTYRGLVIAESIGDRKFGEKGHGGSLVFVNNDNGRKILGILIATDGELSVIAPLAPLFRRYDLEILKDEDTKSSHTFASVDRPIELSARGLSAQEQRVRAILLAKKSNSKQLVRPTSPKELKRRALENVGDVSEILADEF